jgi:hypothetical protein
MSNSKETQDLLAELDAEFGKSAKRGKGADKRSYFNQAKHQGVQTTEKPPGNAREQVERLQFPNFSDWQAHIEMRAANEWAAGMDWRPSWIPDARITYVVVQRCDCCADSVSFIGGEYVRFQSKRIRGSIIRRAEVCTDLFHYALQGSNPLEDIIEELHQSVARCPGCIRVEQKALELWDAMVQKQPQQEMELTPKERTNGN